MRKLIPSAGLALIMLIPEPVTFALAIGLCGCLMISAIASSLHWLSHGRTRRREQTADRPHSPSLTEMQPALQN